MLQHANDSINTLKDIDLVRHVIDIMNKFSVEAGSKLNIQRSECMLFRPLRNVCNHIDGIRITTEPVKILGIDLGHIKEQSLEKNWQDRIDNMSKMFDSSEKRRLTLFGKKK